jgi:hypothetical protein
MKLSKRKIIQILFDANQAFRNEPNSLHNTNSGLCKYIENHPLMINNSYTTKVAYLIEILGDKYQDYYSFCNNMSHYYAWKNGGIQKFERADFCLERVENYK